MLKTNRWILAGFFVVFGGSLACAAQTWRLEGDEDWKAVSADKRSRYILEVAKFKKLIELGRVKKAQESLTHLKAEFTELAGADFDAFVEAEMELASGRFGKAMKKYDQFLSAYPESAFYESVLQRQYSVGTAFLGGQKRRVLKAFKMKGYSQGVKIMQRIADRAGDAPIAKSAMVAIAEGYEKREKFIEAYETWQDISSRWPSGRIGKKSLLGMARSMHASYGGPKYDATSLISAKSYYQQYKLRYPEEATEIGISSKLKQIEEQIAYKQFTIGLFYQRTGSKQAANLYYQLVLDNWPNSTAAKMARENIGGASLKEAIK